MIQEEKVIVMDIDGSLCEVKPKDVEYIDLQPNAEVLSRLIDYHAKGFYIILMTSRQMRTHKGNIGRINATTARVLFEWLDKHNIPYDEVHFGKPWCGRGGFYVDDKAIRPSEFVNLPYEKILEITQG